jgi:Tfp pilus assembly protein PilV
MGTLIFAAIVTGLLAATWMALRSGQRRYERMWEQAWRAAQQGPAADR